MSHKTLISGTAYEVVGGAQMIDGTKFQMGGGKTLVGGTAFDVPFAKGIPLSTITPGAILYLNESGSPVPFYIAKHDYESGLNGAGRTLLVRKDCYDKRALGYYNAFSGSLIDTWLNGTWFKLLDIGIQETAGTTKFYCFASGTDHTKQTLSRTAFILSCTELGVLNFGDGTALDSAVCSKLAIAYINGTATTQWTRTPETNQDRMAYITTSGSFNLMLPDFPQGSRPAFTLPGTFLVIQNPDGTYTLAA